VIVGIKERMFVRFYEQSLFGWQQWVSTPPHLPTLKVLVKKVKKLDNQEIVSLLDDSVDVLNDGISNCTRYILLFLPEHLVKRALETKDSDSSLAWLLSAVKHAASF